MAARIGAAGAQHELLDPLIGTGGQVRAVQEIREGTPGGEAKVVWYRQPLAAAATALAWDRARIDITPPGSGADTYTISRGGTQLHSGPETTYTDTGLLPATAYTWQVEAFRGGEKVGTATAAATTPARSDLGLTASPAAWNQVNLAWTDPSAGSIDSYRLKRGSTVIYTGTGKSKADTGLAASTNYAYTLEALRGGAVIPPSDTASAKTPVRPTTQKTWEGSRTSWASWTGGCANRGTAELYSGYYSSTQGNQKSHANFTIPAEIRNCVRIDQVWISAWNLHSFNNNGRTVQLAVNHGATAGASCGSTGTAVGLSAAKPGWVGGAEWVEVGGYVCPGRTTIKEEFRVNGAQGFTFNPGPDNNQAYYGYCRNDVRIRIVYTVWA